MAAKEGHVQVVKYLLLNGVTFSIKTVWTDLKQIFIFLKGYIETLEYLSNQVKNYSEKVKKENLKNKAKENSKSIENFFKQEKQFFDNMMKMNFYDVVFNHTEKIDE